MSKEISLHVEVYLFPEDVYNDTWWEEILKNELQRIEKKKCPSCQAIEEDAREIEEKLKDEWNDLIGIKTELLGQEIVMAPGEIMKACRIHQRECSRCKAIICNTFPETWIAFLKVR